MSYGQRVASHDQFVEILNEGEKAGFDHTFKPDQISGLMEGVTVILSIEEMSADYLRDIATGDEYNPHHRVRATILFDYSTYAVDVPDKLLFALPTVADWQTGLPVIHLPSEVIEKILDETPEPPNEALREAAKRAKELIRSGAPKAPEEGWDAVAAQELTDKYAEAEAERKADEDAPEYLDGEEGEEGGSGVREPLPDDSPAPTQAAKREPRKRAARARKAPETSTGESVPLETPVG